MNDAIDQVTIDQRVWPEIFFEDDFHLVLNKPSGIYVHPPENPRYRRGLKRHTCTQWLKDQKSMIAFPAHRLDYATEGLILFGKSKSATQKLNEQFVHRTIKKTYWAVVRGWLKEKESAIEIPLELDSTGEIVECQTFYKVLHEVEWPVQVSKKFSTTRYSLIEVSPHTGRWHQIRRHMNRISHPIIGDREHGDSHHNRFFRDQLKIDGLCLWARQLKYLHPETNQETEILGPISTKWQNLVSLFQDPQRFYSLREANEDTR